MAKSQKSESTLLLKPRETVAAELSERIEMGHELAGRAVSTQDELTETRNEYYTWNDYNAELLRRRFTTEQFYEEYRHSIGVMAIGPSSLQEGYRDFHRDVQRKIRKLESVVERLPLIDESSTVVESLPGRKTGGSAVFVVHGHDEGAREGVARFLEKMGLDVIILHEQVSKGMTLIEKFEAHAENAGYAVVLLTPDDEGRSTEADIELFPRARQNVVFEAGFFYGVLGRDRVALMYSKGVEKPSDVDGVAWIPLERDIWKLELGKELKEAGFSIDLNKI